ncbi:MAG: DnaA/Hda family protein [Pelagimonas sp.]|jgi:chromosomal replication initiation ATPase DnaA|nr:DnaA/Hda family protein [Pelagimonas sp.]
MTKPKQLALPLPARAARGREDFYVTTANALAVAQIEGWQIWPARKLVLSGPSGAGKTHLAHVWAALSGAQIIDAKALQDSDIPALSNQNVCVENVESVAGNRPAEEALFHLHNLVLSQGHALLLTSERAPNHWGLSLPDLQSRMMGAQAAQLSQPDDDLLSALLLKLFADRQIMPAPDVIPFLTRHMPRSYRAAAEIVDALDLAAMGRTKGVNRPLAAQVLEDLAASME